MMTFSLHPVLCSLFNMWKIVQRERQKPLSGILSTLGLKVFIYICFYFLHMFRAPSTWLNNHKRHVAVFIVPPSPSKVFFFDLLVPLSLLLPLFLSHFSWCYGSCFLLMLVSMLWYLELEKDIIRVLEHFSLVHFAANNVWWLFFFEICFAAHIFFPFTSKSELTSATNMDVNVGQEQMTELVLRWKKYIQNHNRSIHEEKSVSSWVSKW